MPQKRDLNDLNTKLTRHMDIILRCSAPSSRFGKVLLATPPHSRYPYVYPRDTSAALQLFRRLAGSRHGYDAAPQAFALMHSMATFMRDTVSEDGNWGQRYTVEGEDRSIYKQEDNVAHGIAIICNYLLTAHRLKQDPPELDSFLEALERGLHHAHGRFYHHELNLFLSTTSIHESALEKGYTCWVNFAFLYAFSLAHEVVDLYGSRGIICEAHVDFRRHFLHSVSELFLWGDRYVRRIDPNGQIDFRPDITLLSPFYFGFLHYRNQIKRSARIVEQQLWDPELGMIMRYLPFRTDFATHLHAGNGPWLQYTAILAQYHYWSGNRRRGDQLLAAIDRYSNADGEIPEHLSTCARFEEFIELEWKTGIDFAKEFDKRVMLDGLEFDRILEEVNNMARSYQETGSRCMFRESGTGGGGYIQFATPLMWSHVEYARALLVRSGDWWKTGGGPKR